MKPHVHFEDKKKTGKAGVTDLISSHSFEDSEFSRSICSSMDCTGLIPALPSSEAELEAYEEMYQFCFPPASKES